VVNLHEQLLAFSLCSHWLLALIHLF